MRRRRTFITTAAFAVLVTITVSAPPADAATRQGPRIVTCSAAIMNPHYSEGAKSVIFKTRITCNGDAPPVMFRLHGTLGSIGGRPPAGPGSPPAQGPPAPQATSDQVQEIAMGSTVTFYTPRLDSTTKVIASAYYQGDVTGDIVGPPGVVSNGPAHGSSNRVYVVAVS